MTEERPEEYEELYLSNLESQNVMVISEVEAFTTKMRNNDTTDKDILSMIRRLGEYERYFLFYNPLVEHFAKADKPQLSQRLEVVLSDIRGTIQIFQQIIDKKTSDANKDPKATQMSDTNKYSKTSHMSEEERAALIQSVFIQTKEKD